MKRQNDQALRHDFTFLRSSAHVKRFVDLELLVPVRGNADYRLHQVSFPYARPEVRTFVERLSRQYRSACGEQLVVTSLTRPKSRQPPNASPKSVHPAGMAVDLRRSNFRPCRAWLEDVLIHLEGSGVLEATRESRPPHYHVAVYPNPYAEYVARVERNTGTGVLETRIAKAEVQKRNRRYRVRPGDSLWNIARNYGTTVDELKSTNRLRSSRIYPGQVLALPIAFR